MQIILAETMFRRMRGLLGRTSLPAGEGMLIRPCNAVHTLGMKFALDVRFYNRKGVLVKVVQGVPPGRFWVWGGRKAHCVLECTAGDPAFAALDVLPDDLIHTRRKR